MFVPVFVPVFDPVQIPVSVLKFTTKIRSDVLGILREEQLIARCRERGQQLQEHLTDQFGQHPHVAEIRGEGLLLGIEIVKDRDSLERFPESDQITGKLIAKALQSGVFFYPGGTGEARDILCIGAPFIIDDEEIDLMANALNSALEHCLS